jgi:hypothetical protein
MGFLFIGVLLLIACGQALSQSTPPSRLNPTNPISPPYFHIFSCYDISSGDLLNCQIFDELVGPSPDPANSAGHTHGGTFPLTDGSVGANGFICLSCTDFNNDPFIVQTFTNSSTAVILHAVPQFAGNVQVRGSSVPPPGWVCITSCNFQFVVPIGVDGLSTLPFPGPNLSYDNSRTMPDPLHPNGSSGTSDTLIGIAAIAQGYLYKTGVGLKINDLSLPRGGKFDLGGAYAENDAHASHREGKDVDIGKVNLAGTSIDCFRNSKDLQQLLTANGVGPVRLCEGQGGAYHIRFN